MNDLYLIGNGFDLAHGLKTSYNDFLLWYLNDFLEKYRINGYPEQFEDDLLKIVRNDIRINIPEYNSVSELWKGLKDNRYNLKGKHGFFQKIIEDYRDLKWVDIEYEYYVALVKIFKQIENIIDYNRDNLNNRVNSLNICFYSIRKKLSEYLENLQLPSNLEKREIEKILLEGNGPEGNEEGNKLFVCFNYTPTIELYTKRYFLKNNNLIYIHGELTNPSNPIIFGYGDEIDTNYEKIENLNDNEFLKNIKSFGYFRTDNYQQIMRFLEGSYNSYTVKILGHSCGLSDRVLLNTIFEHGNCEAIKIYYYQKSETENDYFEKTQEISRHFKSTSKAEMRNKIIPFDRSCPLLPFKK